MPVLLPTDVARQAHAPEVDILRAARLLVDGRLVAFPTETVYGLGADATAPAAVARIFAAKGRPSFNPLIAHVATLDRARREGIFTPDAERLAAAFWPGPLTLVLPRAPGGTVCDLACAGLASVGLRMPAHPVSLALLRAADRPIAAPSANRSGRLSPTCAADVVRDLGDRVDLVLDGGAGAAGVIAPGMLTSHYAPDAALRLDAVSLAPDEAGLDFARRFGGSALDLSPSGDLTEAAANLFGYLRRLDDAGSRRIAVAPVPETGLGAAINDRLRRAAAPRP